MYDIKLAKKNGDSTHKPNVQSTDISRIQVSMSIHSVGYGDDRCIYCNIF